MVEGRRHRERQPWHYSSGRRRVLVSSPPPASRHVLASQGPQRSPLVFCRMSFADWCKFFTEADVCRLINTSMISVHKTWHEVVHFGSWTKNAEPLLNRCGGCSNHRQTFLQNPQAGALFPPLPPLLSTPSKRMTFTHCIPIVLTVPV